MVIDLFIVIRERGAMRGMERETVQGASVLHRKCPTSWWSNRLPMVSSIRNMTLDPVRIRCVGLIRGNVVFGVVMLAITAVVIVSRRNIESIVMQGSIALIVILVLVARGLFMGVSLGSGGVRITRLWGTKFIPISEVDGFSYMPYISPRETGKRARVLVCNRKTATAHQSIEIPQVVQTERNMRRTVDSLNDFLNEGR